MSQSQPSPVTGAPETSVPSYDQERLQQLLHNETVYSAPVEAAVDQMENMMREPVLEGERPKPPTAVVAEVLTKERPTKKFIKNIGLPQPSSKGSVSSRVQDLQLQLQVSDQQKADLVEKLRAQDEKLEALNKRAEEASKKRAKDIDNLKQKFEDTNSLLRGFLGLMQGQSNASH